MTIDQIPLSVWVQIVAGFFAVTGLVFGIGKLVAKILTGYEERISSQISGISAEIDDVKTRLTQIETTVFPYSTEINKLKDRFLAMVEKSSKRDADIENLLRKTDEHQRQIENLQQRNR